MKKLYLTSLLVHHNIGEQIRHSSMTVVTDDDLKKYIEEGYAVSKDTGDSLNSDTENSCLQVAEMKASAFFNLKFPDSHLMACTVEPIVDGVLDRNDCRSYLMVKEVQGTDMSEFYKFAGRSELRFPKSGKPAYGLAALLEGFFERTKDSYPLEPSLQEKKIAQWKEWINEIDVSLLSNY